MSDIPREILGGVAFWALVVILASWVLTGVDLVRQSIRNRRSRRIALERLEAWRDE